MIRPRIIPVLLLRGRGLVKGIKFSDYTYVGDPINAVRIFSRKEVDELIFLDIDATKESRLLSLDLIQDIADECFMPFGFGGGIRSIAQIEKILKCGAEKVVINTYASENLEFIREASQVFGSQAIVASVDVLKSKDGQYFVYTNSGQKKEKLVLEEYLQALQTFGTGEILLTSINRDGVMRGYDIEVNKLATKILNIPLISCGGAGEMEHIEELLIEANPAAAAAGSMFIFQGTQRGVLINYPDYRGLENLYSKIEKVGNI